MFILTNNKYYIDKTFSLTTDYKKAYQWQTKEKALNVLNDLMRSSIKKNIDETFKIVKTENENKEFNLDFDIKDLTEELKDKVNQLNQRKDYLLKNLSLVDQETSDCLHCAENYVLNASQGYKLYKMLHELRIKRREIKNELASITQILNSKIEYNSIVQLNDNIDNIYGERPYIPRVVNDLFDLVK